MQNTETNQALNRNLHRYLENERRIAARGALVFNRKVSFSLGEKVIEYDVTLHGRHIATVSKGWSRNGGTGWIITYPNRPSSLTIKNLDDCRNSIAVFVARQTEKPEPKKEQPCIQQWELMSENVKSEYLKAGFSDPTIGAKSLRITRDGMQLRNIWVEKGATVWLGEDSETEIVRGTFHVGSATFITVYRGRIKSSLTRLEEIYVQGYDEISLN
jgi:hypothetical protein